jgi:DNA-binding winged helix-turn-helix (wHTH) protein
MLARMLVVGGTSLDESTWRVSTASGSWCLEPVEYSILYTMMTSCGAVVSHDKLAYAVYGRNPPNSSYFSIRARLMTLRRALKEINSSIVIETVRGLGLVAPATKSDALINQSFTLEQWQALQLCVDYVESHDKTIRERVGLPRENAAMATVIR